MCLQISCFVKAADERAAGRSHWAVIIATVTLGVTDKQIGRMSMLTTSSGDQGRPRLQHANGAWQEAAATNSEVDDELNHAAAETQEQWLEFLTIMRDDSEFCACAHLSESLLTAVFLLQCSKMGRW